MRVLKASKAPAAAAAIDHLVYHIVKFAGAYTAVLGGLDALVFTAGIGENDAQLRAKVLAKLAWMGAKLDPDANDRNGPRISTAGQQGLGVGDTHERGIDDRPAYRGDGQKRARGGWSKSADDDLACVHD